MALPGATQQNQPAKGGYQIGKPGGVCAVSGRAIAAGERFMAAVRYAPAGMERVDVAMENWAAFDHAALEVLAFWQGVMPHAEAKRKAFVDDEVLCTVFERLGNATEPAKISFRFVLGLILMRKRLVVYEDTRHDLAHDVWVVRMRGRNEKLDLIDPKLDEARVMDVSQQLGEILNDE